jgi:hypothetical protein
VFQCFDLFSCTRPALSPAAGNRIAAWICQLLLHSPRPSVPSTIPLSGPSPLASRSTPSHHLSPISILSYPPLSTLHHLIPPSPPTNPLSLCVDERYLITARSFTVVRHVRSADGSVPRLLVGAVLEGFRPRPADVRALSFHSQAERSEGSRRSAPPGSDPRP